MSLCELHAIVTHADMWRKRGEALVKAPPHSTRLLDQVRDGVHGCSGKCGARSCVCIWVAGRLECTHPFRLGSHVEGREARMAKSPAKRSARALCEQGARYVVTAQGQPVGVLLTLED